MKSQPITVNIDTPTVLIIYKHLNVRLDLDLAGLAPSLDQERKSCNMELAKLADTPEEEYLDQVNYRDMSFSVYLDRRNSIYYTIVAGKRIVICPAGESYREKIQSAIDENLFCAEDFGDSAKLI